MAQKIIAANWKMNKTNKEALAFAAQFKNPSKNKVIIAAPFTTLTSLSVAKRDFDIAAQDVSANEKGAFTGEISASMLKELKVKYCLVGHSERRIYHSEPNEVINAKIKELQKKNITPILCFGETAQEKKNKQTKRVIAKQLKEGLKGVDLSKIILAYEPVWAISTFQKSKKKVSASEEDIATTHAYIKDIMTKLFTKKAGNIPVLYGGSVHAKNSVNFINYDDVDGVLVGGASLMVSSFTAIINNVA